MLGVLHVGSLTPRDFTADDRELLQLAADRAAIAIEHAQLFEQRRIAETLQRHLLPQELPAIAGLELACRYLPAAGASLGGDWYDVFELPGGRVVLAVGDVVGHGVVAAAVMAQLRTALRAYAAEGHPPALVVESVNRLMWSLGPTAMTTLAYGVLDPAEEELELVVAGHPPALLVSGEAAAHYLPLHGGMALGASQTSTYRSQTVPFPAGSTLVLYTDGLVERRGESIDDGLERLRAIGERIDDVESLCTRLLEDHGRGRAAGRRRRHRRPAAAADRRPAHDLARPAGVAGRRAAPPAPLAAEPTAPPSTRPTTSSSPARRHAPTRSSMRTGPGGHTSRSMPRTAPHGSASPSATRAAGASRAGRTAAAGSR